MRSLFQASEDHRIDAVFSSLDIIGTNDIDCNNPGTRPQRSPALNIKGGAKIDKGLSIGGQLCMLPGAVINGDLSGNLIGDTFVFGNLAVSGMVVVDNDIVSMYNIEGDQIIASNLCATDTVFADTILPKTESAVTFQNIIANDIVANSVVVAGNSLMVSFDDLVVNTLTANTATVTGDFNGNVIFAEEVCITGQILVDTLVPKTGMNIEIEGGLTAGDVVARNVTAGNVFASNIAFDGDTVIMGNVASFNSLDVTTEINSNLIVGSTICVNDELLANKLIPKSGDFVEIIANVFTREIVAEDINVTGQVFANVIVASNVITSNVVVTHILQGASPILVLDDLLPFRLPEDPFKTLRLGTTNQFWDEIYGNTYTGIDGCFTGNLVVDKITPKTGTLTLCGTVQADDIVANSITISGNTMMVNLDDITSNTITTNVITILDKVIGDTTVDGDVCITGQVIVDEISPKTGNTLVLNGTLQADEIVANTITISGNALMVDLDNINSNVIQANLIITETFNANVIVSNVVNAVDICATGEILADEISPKTLGANVFVDGNLQVNVLYANFVKADCIDYTRVEVNSPTYTLGALETIIGVKYTTTGPPTITLPLISTLPYGRKRYVIVDEGGNASMNGITIETTLPNQIVGGNSVVLMGNYNSMTVYSDEGNDWFII